MHIRATIYFIRADGRYGHEVLENDGVSGVTIDTEDFELGEVLQIDFVCSNDKGEKVD